MQNSASFDDKLIKTIKLLLVSVIALGVLIIGFHVFLLFFAGVLLAIFLINLTYYLMKYTKWSYGKSLTTVCLSILFIITASAILLAPVVSEQFFTLIDEIPKSYGAIRAQISALIGEREFLKQLDQNFRLGDLLQDKTVLRKATSFLGGVVGALVGFLIVLFTGIYGAAEPEVYKRGLLYLFPKEKKERAAAVVDEVSHTLARWLVGRFAGMAFTGLLVTIGLWALGIPLALILGIIVAFATFIPNIGPIIGAIPAVLVGLTYGVEKALLIVLLFTVVETIESYVTTPLIQRHMVFLPPALILFVQILFGVLIGPIGIALATPLMAGLLVVIKRIYVEDTLGYQLQS